MREISKEPRTNWMDKRSVLFTAEPKNKYTYVVGGGGGGGI